MSSLAEEIAEKNRLDRKEAIAACIFDHDHDPPESRPSEQACHEIAEKILSLGDRFAYVPRAPKGKPTK